MTDEITTTTINPHFFSVVKFKGRKNDLKDRREGSMMLEYKNRDIYIMGNTIFYQLLRLIKLPIAEYRKFQNDDKNRLLNVYFRTLSSSLKWDLDISKRQNTFRHSRGESFQCAIYSVFSIRKTPIEKKQKEAKHKAIKIYKNEQERIIDENPLYVSIGLVVMAFCLYFFFVFIGGN